MAYDDRPYGEIPWHERPQVRETHDGRYEYVPGQGPPSHGQAPGAETPPITQRYDDAYGQLLESLRRGKSGNELLGDLLGGFRGSIGDLSKFMETPAYRGAMAYSIKGMPEYQQLRDLKDPTQGALSVGLGQISAAGARGMQQSMQQLNQMGMGRNAALMGGVQQGAEFETAGRSAELTAKANQQQYQNATQRFGQMLELEQAIQHLAMGFNPAQRRQDNGPSSGDWMQAVGELAGLAVALI